MSDEDLELNTIDRFVKHSERLVLEEYSHCEVPAGCGGVVIRWVDPRGESPLQFRFYHSHTRDLRHTIWLDGREVQRSFLPVKSGRHVVGICVNDVPASGFLLFGVTNRDVDGLHRSGGHYADVNVVTAPDGTWKYSLAVPSAHWLEPEFDDADWSAMTAADVPPPEGHPWSWDKATEIGAQGLGIGQSAERVWIRRVFEVDLGSDPADPDLANGTDEEETP